MPENDKTGIVEENFSLHCFQDVQKDLVILICFHGKTFTGNPVFNKQNDWDVKFENDVSEHRTSSLNHDAGRRSIEREEYDSGLVWMRVHDNFCSLQRSFEDESSSIGREDH